MITRGKENYYYYFICNALKLLEESFHPYKSVK